MFSKHCFVFLLLVSSVGCKDDEDPEKNEPGVSDVTLNGGQYSNLTAKSTSDEPAVAVFSATDNMTSVTYTAMAGAKEFYVIVAFPGSAKGQHAWNEDNCFAQAWEDYQNSSTAVSANYYDANGEVHTGTVKIDNYGSVGGLVTGSFEGDVTFVEIATGAMTTGTMKGTFSARRIN